MKWYLLLNIVGVAITLFLLTPFIIIPLLVYHKARFKNELELIAEYHPHMEQEDLDEAFMRTFGGERE
jgi:uncharacterized membrane protein YbaN (DUF454 family)